MDQQTFDRIYEKHRAIGALLGYPTPITPEQLADEYLKAREAVTGLAEAVRAYFAFINDTKRGSRRPIEKKMTMALWDVDKYLGEPTKRADKEERASRRIKK